MSDLDKKLLEVAERIREGGMNAAWNYDLEEDLRAIKQAFIDDGWIDTGISKTVKDQINLYTREEWEAKAIKDGWNKPFDNEGIINFGTKEQPIMIHKDSLPFTSFNESAGFVEIPEGHNGRVLMTGQEWHDRFEKELSKLEGSYHKWVGPLPSEVLGAAKKAAAIS